MSTLAMNKQSRLKLGGKKGNALRSRKAPALGLPEPDSRLCASS